MCDYHDKVIKGSTASSTLPHGLLTLGEASRHVEDTQAAHGVGPVARNRGLLSTAILVRFPGSRSSCSVKPFADCSPSPHLDQNLMSL